MGVNAMWNANSHVQDLNMCRRVHFLRQLPLYYEHLVEKRTHTVPQLKNFSHRDVSHESTSFLQPLKSLLSYLNFEETDVAKFYIFTKSLSTDRMWYKENFEQSLTEFT